MIGLHAIVVVLHPEVEAKISINVARNADEAERQARGEDVTRRRDEDEEDAAAAAEAAAFFEKPEDAAGDQGSGEDEKAD
jgi:large subunit ribosomal protein L9